MLTPEIATTATRTARALFDLLQRRYDGKGWAGACHALSSIGYVVMREQGLEVTPCLGEAVRHVPIPGAPPATLYFDHSWLEVDDYPIDVAVWRQLEGVPPIAPVIFGRHIDDGRPSEIDYGVEWRGLDSDGRRIFQQTIGKYMDGFTEEPNGLWDLALQVGARVDLSLDVASLRDRYGAERWVFRGPNPTAFGDSDDGRRRARNRRKQGKRKQR